MDKKIKKVTILTSCILMILGFVGSPPVSFADDISVSGNAANSSNTVNVSASQQTITQQSNTSQTANNTNTSASTGNNNASDTTGGSTAVQTGNASTSTTVNTTVNNSSVSQTPDCCTSPNTKATITGNGDGSTNTVAVSNTTATTVSINQDANVTNNVSQSAVTGHNSANGNNADVTVETGNIIAQETVQNGPINISHVSQSSDENGSVQVTVSGNGVGSVNTVSSNSVNTNMITVTNCATVINNLKSLYLTGGNSANSNNGQVSIITGNISSMVTIQNGPINVNTVENKEHAKSTPPPPPTPTPQPTNSGAPSSSPSSSSPSNNSSSSSSNGTGSVMGASANNLPVTGNYWFFIALIGNILMMLLGGYLRLHSGRSPGVAGTL